MAVTPFEVIGIGNAIVDVIAPGDDAFLTTIDLVKNSMTLVDAERSEAIYARMAPGTEMSGGSAANTMAGFASLGGHGAYIGKVRDDQLGAVFRHDIEAAGVRFLTPAATNGPSTARCMITVTPDAHRTMATYLGACVHLGPEDLDREALARCGILYLEGYLYDRPEAQAAFQEAAGIVHEAGGKVSYTLSDSFCVDRHRAAFRELVSGHVDILFANEAELLSLTETASIEAAVAAIRPLTPLAAVTRSEHGSIIIAGDQTIEVPADPVSQLVDTTGAGDLYAAGFLFGVARGLDLATAGRLGSLAAGEVISHVGARPLVSLKALAAERGLA